MREFLKYVEKQNPGKTAYISSSGSLTYGELIHGAKCLAYDLRGSKTPVIVSGHKESFMITAFLACLMCGRAYVPCDSCFPEERKKCISEITGSDTEINSATVFGDTETEEYCGDDNDTAYIIFTSGSSGKPKGVPVRRNSLKNFIGWMNSLNAMKAAANGRVLNQARFSFDLSVADIYFSLSNGLTLCALTSLEQSSPADLERKISEYDPSVMVITPTFAKYCLCMGEFSKRYMPSLRTVFFCGEILEPGTVSKLFSRFPGVRIINAYGPTEATCAVTACEITEDMTKLKSLPCGDGNSSCSIRIDAGEIVLSGEAVFDGYIGAKEMIDEYYTGDMGRFENGCLFCDGRKSGYIKYAGYRIETEEIRKAALQLEGVSQCTVKPVYSSSGTVTAISCAVVAPGKTPADIKQWLGNYLPPYMIPGQIRVCDRISFNENGKQDI